MRRFGAQRRLRRLLYERLQRNGFLQRDCQRLVNQDRNHFASCMVALGTPTPWSPASPATSPLR